MGLIMKRLFVPSFHLLNLLYSCSTLTAHIISPTSETYSDLKSKGDLAHHNLRKSF